MVLSITNKKMSIIFLLSLETCVNISPS